MSIYYTQSHTPTRNILLLSANPKGTSQLRLAQEMRDIREGLRLSENRDLFTISSAEAVRPRDIHRAILTYKPQIIHFSGHGSPEEGLLFEDETGGVNFVDGEALAGLFELFANQVECVVLNACYSKYQAAEIARHINYVVGMSQEIQDKAAIEFAVGFYDGLGAGEDYDFAYKLGCNAILMAGIKQHLIPELISSDTLNENLNLQLPSTNLPRNNNSELSQNIYIDRTPIEEKCYQEILQPGALIRVKAPQRMGKTWLLENLLSSAREQGYQTAKLDLQQAENSILDNLKSFLQWVCVDVSDSLDIEPEVNEIWQDIYGVNKNCTRYFQKHLLSASESPLVFAIDNFERLFAYPDIFSQFCLLLRGWYENAKGGDRVANIWKKLRLVVVHSTENYPVLDSNHSPFNVGIPIELPEFNRQQVKAFAGNYALDKQLGEQGLIKLMESIGGHPYLLQQAFINLKNQQINLEQLLSLAPTEQGIFSDHLRQQLWHLQHNSQLELGYKKVVRTNAPVRLDAEVAFKLHSLGLVKLSGNDCLPSCDLYRQYFSERLG
ncbi:AAA-like domain-containing protein [Brunnivagina elsteri]|uniref:Adenylate cyclase n=1 Tax=Brunnivagina elsteri CCALA 953 TaxID=987040 RepID=A0A2A2TGF5_9CYAN|nr:AAA-like domain-containing protein [Calothrix elsteri]PAX52771.1 adenylate cyclase [Calothrix elsteri CCALA 953]